MVSSEPTWHVSRVQKRVSKFVNFKVQKVQKPELFDLTDNGFCSSDARGLICHIPHLCAIFQTNNVGLGTCATIEDIKLCHDAGMPLSRCSLVVRGVLIPAIEFGIAKRKPKSQPLASPPLPLQIN